MKNLTSYSYRKWNLWMVAALVCVAVVLGIYPADRTVWCVEMVWAVGLWAILLLTRRKFRFSPLAYLCFFVWTVLQLVGAHYTFELVPMDWLKEPLGLVRNPYDRIAHFAVGWFAFPLAELFFRKGWVKSAGFAAFFAVMSTIAMAGIWELVEWIYAEVEGGAAGAAFLGSQGDVWDAQKDILCDTLGAMCATTLFLWLVRRDYWIVKGPGGIPILNPENDAPTMTWTLKHNRIWDVVGIVVILAAISAIAGLLWLCAIGIRNLESRFLWAGTSRAIPLIDGTNLPIRLKAITMPEVYFYAPATMKEFAEYMSQATKDFDDPAVLPEKRGIRFVCTESVAAKTGPEKQKPDAPLIPCPGAGATTTAWVVLTNVCHSVGCTFEVGCGEVEIGE